MHASVNVFLCFPCTLAQHTPLHHLVFSGDEEEEVGGASHLPKFGAKHTTMLVIEHFGLLASLFEVSS